MLTKDEKIELLKELIELSEDHLYDNGRKDQLAKAQQWLSELEAVSLNCPVCAETFKSDIDLEAHLFNNKHCTIHPPVK